MRENPCHWDITMNNSVDTRVHSFINNNVLKISKAVDVIFLSNLMLKIKKSDLLCNDVVNVDVLQCQNTNFKGKVI